MRRVALLTTMLLFSTVACLCQIKIPLVDISAAGSPVRISGTVLFQDDPATAVRYTYLINGSVTNVTNKRIVLTIIHMSATGVGAPGLDHSVAVERFFDSNTFMPGRIEGIDHSPIKFGPVASVKPVPAETGQAASPSATAELIFLQFADGSTWGDPDVGSQQLLLRRRSLMELHRLENVLDGKGEVGLKDELSRVDQFNFPAIYSLVHICTNKPTSCLVDKLRSMLKEANLRQAEMGVASSEKFTGPK
jgi:hypothetical protein